MLVVLTTTPTKTEADILAVKLVEARLAACVQVLPEMTSVYEWNGEIRRDAEHLLLIKTLPEQWDQLVEFVAANHSYEVPEILALEAEKISGAYLDWINKLLR